MKRFFLLASLACALAGNLKAGVVEVEGGYFVSDADAEKLGLLSQSQPTHPQQLPPSPPVSTTTPTQNSDPLPKAVHVGDTVDDALAYAKQLIPFLKTHQPKGRIEEENTGIIFRVIIAGAKDTGHFENTDEMQYFVKIVSRELTKAGVIN